jgi:hypothetical protein
LRSSNLCQTRCFAINVAERGVLAESAIVIEAGPGKEDRLLRGSYIALREQEAIERQRSTPGSRQLFPGLPGLSPRGEPKTIRR